jgi:hypothetical protein
MLEDKKGYETHTQRTINEHSGYAVTPIFFEHGGETEDTDYSSRRQKKDITHS